MSLVGPYQVETCRYRIPTSYRFGKRGKSGNKAIAIAAGWHSTVCEGRPQTDENAQGCSAHQRVENADCVRRADSPNRLPA